ncbi:BON domain-containing protein [Acidovorax sp. ACV01]|uniref:BON domain-containing protein n=1 Tax=Acidovorax sp. ACV01 TaxID=2769311 RepID=UPI001CE16F6C|nr:BON domain-containing protein [Acidovorax sp. ACV01]
MRHPTPRQLSGAFLGALAVMSLQGCKRIDMVTDWAPASPSPIAYLEDSVLTSRVRAALILSPVVNSFHLGVESHRGVVLLSGMAADPTQIDLAVFVAQTVPGVSSVDSFMFSTGIPPTLAVSKNYTPSPAALRTQRLLGHTPHPEATHPEEQPSAPAPAVVSLSHPLAPEKGQSADDPPKPSRWVHLAHSVLGIRSIQDELLVKQ